MRSKAKQMKDGDDVVDFDVDRDDTYNADEEGTVQYFENVVNNIVNVKVQLEGVLSAHA